MRFLPFLVLLALGMLAGYYLSPLEREAVQNHLLGFPNAQADLHLLRPYAVWALALLPALGALWYACAGIIDRYLFRKTLSSFLIATSAILILYLLLDLQDSISEISKAKNPLTFLPAYYGVLLAQILVLLLPFTILLGLLYALGQLSTSREVIAMTQTGRGIFRFLLPLTVLGGLLSLASFLLNYHLTPWAEGYREALLESTKRGSTSQATNVLHYNPDDRRLWFIGRFPYNLASNAALLDVEITTLNQDGSLKDRFKSSQATYLRETEQWIFHNPVRLLAQTQPTPEYQPDLPEKLLIDDWPETPSLLVQEGLDARYLGIPQLNDWLHAHPDRSSFLARSFESQFHYRWAQPWLCLITVLLAAPLGINYSRRGPGGTLAVAVILAALMLFLSEVFLALGDSGQLPPVPAAWATNAIFLLLALLLIQRRLAGRPIFQTLGRLFGN